MAELQVQTPVMGGFAPRAANMATGAQQSDRFIYEQDASLFMNTCVRNARCELYFKIGNVKTHNLDIHCSISFHFVSIVDYIMWKISYLICGIKHTIDKPIIQESIDRNIVDNRIEFDKFDRVKYFQKRNIERVCLKCYDLMSIMPNWSQTFTGYITWDRTPELVGNLIPNKTRPDIRCTFIAGDMQFC